MERPALLPLPLRPQVKTSFTSKLSLLKKDIKSAELAERQKRWTNESGRMNEFASARGSLDAPQAVSVAIDLVSEWLPPAARPPACILCCQPIDVKELTAEYQLRAALISSIDFNPNYGPSSDSPQRAVILIPFLFPVPPLTLSSVLSSFLFGCANLSFIRPPLFWSVSHLIY